ncbi:cupin domain-containing protein [Streptomyces sp. MP131-18]|uniref:cupin domain-containing protein n=1 Tax=Streptomyces sp. MP131-18 TaxID=1857892 RepID=UPI00097BD912|nr:cupin domain-containing protein [Streptomyces sp. MP131-18]ONK09710.1 Cupin domain protein [Streptomyces sp. MP131-18]
MTRKSIRIALAGGVSLLLALGGTTGTAHATPGSGVTATTLAQYSAGGRDYILREITVAPGGSTGWHYHEGTLYGWVANGTLTHNAADCSVDGIYDAGDFIVEPSGADNVHIGRNLGTTPLVLEVLYVLPDGAPPANDAPDPGCSIR